MILLNKYDKIFLPKQELFEPAPIIASKINLKQEIPQKFISNLHYNYDFNRQPSQNQNFLKAPIVNENKGNAVNYKNIGVSGSGYSSVNSVQSKHYNYPKSSSSILNGVGQYNIIRYTSNNNNNI